jgi:ferrochelatase
VEKVFVRYVGDAAYSHDAAGRAAVLLVNLGTPDLPTTGAVRRFLAEFLWDPRVVEIPRPLWWLVLNVVVLPLRLRRTVAAYKKIWTDEGSPLLVYSHRQRDGLEQALARRLPGELSVALAMRYGNPSIPEALAALRAARVRRVLVLPLYPQYCSATAGSVFDALSAELRRWRWVPALRLVDHYHDEPGFITALAQSVREHWRAHAPGERLLFSFHGIPRQSVLAGDPYYCQCLKTARLVAEALELPKERWAVSFQSRVGRAEWLKPYTAELLPQWASAGVRTVDVICPGFSADCLETLEEIALRNREDLEHAGGTSLNYVPALNARPDHIEFLADLVLRHLQGWSEVEAETDPRIVAESARRARELGAKH